PTSRTEDEGRQAPRPRADDHDESDAAAAPAAPPSATADKPRPSNDDDSSGEARTAQSAGDKTDQANQANEAESGDSEDGDNSAKGANTPVAQGFAQVLAHSNSAVAPAVLSVISNGDTAPGVVAEAATTAAGATPAGLAPAIDAETPTAPQASAGATKSDPPAAAAADGKPIQTETFRPQITVSGADALVSRPSADLVAAAGLTFDLGNSGGDGAAGSKGQALAGGVQNAASGTGGNSGILQLAQAPSNSDSGPQPANANQTAAAASNVQAAAGAASAAVKSDQPGADAPASQNAANTQSATVDRVAPVSASAPDTRTAATQTQGPNLPRGPVPLPAPADQVAVHIAKAVAEDLDRITIQLKPEQLGRITVRLDVATGSHVTAVVSADRPETLQLLQRDARGLEQALQDAGLQMGQGSLSFNLGGQDPRGSSLFPGADQAANPSYGPVASGEPEPAPIVLSNAVPSSGGVDIRV
ncbi:MAG: flagellar hook-length control protein FliK, partial [Alphaproteobacteria bacterium]